MTIDLVQTVPAALSAAAAVAAAVAAWRIPISSARLVERMRRADERAREISRHKREVFATLMQERAEIYSEEGVKALNLIDIVFNDATEVREAWSELFLAFNLNPLPPHVLEERLRKLIGAMASDIGLTDRLRTDDLGRIYRPNAIAQDRIIKDIQRQQTLKSLQEQQSPASNTQDQASPFPPKPV